MSDTSSSTTKCFARPGGEEWRPSEVSFGARSLLVRTIDGSRPVEWLPYSDVADVSQVEPAEAEPYVEVTVRDGRRMSMQLDEESLAALLEALEQPLGSADLDSPSPAEFGLGSQRAPEPPAPFEPLPKPSAAPAPPTGPPAVDTEPLTSAAFAAEPEPVAPGGRNRTPLLLAGAAVILVGLLVLAVLVFTGGDDSNTQEVADETTTTVETTAPPVEDQTTTTADEPEGPVVPTTAAEALEVTVADAIAVTSEGQTAVYVAFDARNLADVEIADYRISVSLSAGAETWVLDLVCAAPLPAGQTRSGSLAGGPPSEDLGVFLDCRVGGWPVNQEVDAERTVAATLETGGSTEQEVTVDQVTLVDGRTLR